MKKSKAATIEMVKQEIARRERAYKRALKASTKAINAALNDGSDIAAMNRDASLTPANDTPVSIPNPSSI